MVCNGCEKDTDDYIVMTLIRIKDGNVHSNPKFPIALCLDCYHDLSKKADLINRVEDEEQS